MHEQDAGGGLFLFLVVEAPVGSCDSGGFLRLTAHASHGFGDYESMTTTI